MAIFTAIGTAVAGALFGGSLLAASIITGALSFGAKLLINYLFRPKERKYTAVQGEVQYGSDVPVGTMFGTGAIKGHRVYYANWGSGDAINADVFILSNGWCDGLEPEVYFFGKKHTLVPLPIIGGETARYTIEGWSVTGSVPGPRFEARFYDGRPGQVADAQLVARTADLGRPWKSTSVCAGLCYVVVERIYDNEWLEGNGTPEFTWILRGLRLYDPRKDSTVAGGSGTHLLTDPSTWEHSLNPAVQRLNYQLGLRGLISGRIMIGEGKTMGQIDLATYIVAMNVADQIRLGKARYQSSLYVHAEDDHTEILKEWDDAMAGYGLNRRGLSGVIVGAPQIPILELTSDDIPVDRVQNLILRKSAFDLYNTLSGQYISKEDQWEPESLKPISVAADVNSDGRIRQTSNDFLQVTDPDIAQYLLNIRYRQNRHGGQATIPVSRRVGLEVQEGEWIEYVGKEWLITEWQCDPNFNFTLTLSETSADLYDDAEIPVGPVVIPKSPPVNPSILSNIVNFTAEAGALTGEGGQDIPTLRFTWDPPVDPTITQVRFEYRIAGTAEVSRDASNSPEEGLHLTTNGVAPDSDYECRATITTVPDRLKQWTPWILATGTTSVIAADVLDNSITAAKIQDAAVTASKLMDGAVTEIKLADLAVSTAKIKLLAVTSALVANSAIISSKIDDLAVTGAKVALNAITVTKIADGAISGAKLADAIITTAKFAAGLAPVEIVGALPSTGNFEGRQVYLTTDDRMYRHTGGGWTAAIDSVQISGQLTDAQIAAVAAAKLTGQITGTQITDNAITTAKLSAGSVETADLAAGAVVADKIGANAVTALKILAGSVEAGHIATNAVTADKILAGAITTAKIAAGAVSATEIAAGAITTAKMVVSARSAAINPDTGFEDRSIWDFPAVGSGAAVVGTSAGFQGNTVLRVNRGAVGASTFFYYQNHKIPIDPTRAYLLRTAVRRWGGGTGDYHGIWQFWDASGALIDPTGMGWPGSNSAADIFYAPLSGVVPDGTFPWTVFTYAIGGPSPITIPANAAWISPGFAVGVGETSATGFWDLGHFSITEMARGELIVDGAITALKVAANAITAAKIAAGTITATEIAAGAIEASEIATNAVTAVKINALAVTTAKIDAGAVTATEIATGAITAIKISAGAVTAAAIAASTITGDKLVANSITARELILTDFNNMVPDNQARDPATWNLGSGWSWVASQSSGYDSLGYFKYNEASDTGGGTYGSPMFTGYAVIVGGKPYSVGFQLHRTPGTATQHQVLAQIHSYDSGGNSLGAVVLENVLSTDTGVLSKTIDWTPPVNAYTARITFNVHKANTSDTVDMRVAGVSIRRKQGAELIVDGAVTAAKIAANVITASHISAAKIDAAQILQNGTLITDLISANAVSASNAADTAGGFTLSDEIEVEAQSVTITPKNGIVVLTGIFRASMSMTAVPSTPSSEASIRVQVRFKRNTTVFKTYTTVQIPISKLSSSGGLAAVDAYITLVAIDTSPGTSAVTYRMALYRDVTYGGTVPTITIDNRFLQAQNMKK